MMARNPDSVKEEQLASNTAVPTSAYNPMSGNPFVNAIGSTASTPVVASNPIIAANDAATTAGDTAISNTEKAMTNEQGSVNTAFAGLGVPGYTSVGGYTPPPATTGFTSDNLASQGAYDLLKSEFERYGLGALVDSIKGLITQGASGATMSLALQNTDAYKQRFSANQDRIAKGLSALTPAQYVGLEDQYQNVMRNYGLPASYYSKDSTGKQVGFDQLIANDVSNVELEDRIATAQQRVLNANPDVLKTLKQFYPDITNGDILAYSLDPKNALTALKQKVTTSEIGAAQLGAGLASGQTPEQIANYAANAQLLQQSGVTGAQAAQGFGQVAQLAQRGNQLSDIYGQTPYGQTQAQSEVFNLAGQTDAANQRKKLTALEQAQFAGQGGTAQNAFSRDRAISPMMLGVPGAGSF